MTAYPIIVRTTGFYPGQRPDSVTMMALFVNKEIDGRTQGLTKFVPFKQEGGICYYSPGVETITCSPVTRWNLKDLQFVDYATGAFAFGCVESNYCPDAGCPSTCSTAWVRVSLVSDIPIRAFSTTAPNQPPNLVITPGNGALTISWGAVTNVEVFAYLVEIYSGTNIIERGFTESSLMSVTIGNLQNAVAYSVRVYAISHSGIKSVVSTGTGTPVGATDPYVYNTYTTPDSPAAGSSFTISAEIANKGPNGKVRAVFKVDGVQISDQNSTLNMFPGGGLWKPTVSYTMPNKTITITVDGYGWDGTKWVPTHTMSITRTPSVTSCAYVTLTPFSASVQAGGKVTFTAAVTPSTSPFTVQFKDRAGTLLGTCTTSGGSCTYIWDSTGKPAGSYYVKAYVTEGNCISTESVIQVSPPLRQWNVSIYALDSATGKPVQGATVVAGTQTKQTDATGIALFRADEGTVSVSISATGYNTVTTVESVYNDRTFNYPMTSTTPTTGSIMFVSVPSNAAISLDGADQNARTPVQILNIPAGKHTFTLRLAGFNDTAGEVTVTGGGTVQAYATLSPLTTTTGSLSLFSTPPGAGIFIDETDQKATTPATVTGLTPGTHNIRLMLAGYQDWTGTVTINAGQTAYLNPVLTLLGTIGAVEISSVPAGARVFIDGVDTQKVTPATITNISLAAHSYKLVLSGYNDATGTFMIEAGKTTPVPVTLNKSSSGAPLLVVAAIGVGIAALAMKSGGK